MLIQIINCVTSASIVHHIEYKLYLKFYRLTDNFVKELILDMCLWYLLKFMKRCLINIYNGWTTEYEIEEEEE